MDEFKMFFKQEMQYLNELNWKEWVNRWDDIISSYTNWVYNFCSLEFVPGKNLYILYWTSSAGKNYNLFKCFNEFNHFYNSITDLNNDINSFLNYVDFLGK